MNYSFFLKILKTPIIWVNSQYYHPQLIGYYYWSNYSMIFLT